MQQTLLIILSISLLLIANAQTPTGDLTIGRYIQVNSECSGQFCVPGSTNTTDCNGHNSSAINDDNIDTFWASEIFPNAFVIVQLDLESEMEFYDTNILWKSPTPYGMILEQSEDYGNTWTPLRYWSINCQAEFGLPTVNISTDIPIPYIVCTDIQLTNQSGGEISFSTLSMGISNFSITNLRLNLTSLNSENDEDCFQYFAITEWTVNGSCQCNGHATQCKPVIGEPIFPNKIYSGCVCQDRTEGDHCESCQVGYNAVPWTPNNECLMCDCNGHATDCNPDLGCINCTHNTNGTNCATCISGYYANSSLSLTDPNYCIACNCNEDGVVDDGSCDSNGVCNCEVSLEPPKCTACADGYWNLSSDGCQACSGCGNGVTLANSLPLCDKENGTCICQSEFVVGENCDRCKDGRYNISGGCNKNCTCNTITSLGTCDDAGICYCIPNIEGSQCNMVANNFYFKSLDDIKVEGEDGEFSTRITPFYPVQQEYFHTGRGFASLSPIGGNITFTVQVDISSRYLVIVRHYTTVTIPSVELSIESLSNVETSLQCNNNSAITTYNSQMSLLTIKNYTEFGSLCFQHGIKYRVILSYPPQNLAINWLLDSIVFIPDVYNTSHIFNNIQPDMMFKIKTCIPYSLPIITNDSFCMEQILYLSVEFNGQVFACDTPVSIGASYNTCMAYGGSYQCISNFTGYHCDECANGYFDFSNKCQPCSLQCNETGAINVACNATTGQCHCKDGVQGNLCDSCQSKHFNFSSSGCSECNCSNLATGCNPQNGTCNCLYNFVGDTCDQCSENHYGTPLGCISCDCDRGSLSLSCNANTGDCTCQVGAIGRQCNSCISGYYETAIGTNQNFCLPCFCFNHAADDCMSDHSGYTLVSETSDFTNLSCSGNAGNCSDGWILSDDTGNLSVTNAGSSGLMYTIVNGNNPRFIAPSQFHGDYHLAYGQRIEIVFVTSVNNLASGFGYIRLNGSNVTLVSVFPESQIISNLYGAMIRQLTFPLNETYWRVGNTSGNVPSLSQFVSVLTNITGIQFSAEFSEIHYVESNQLHKFQIYYIQQSMGITPSQFTVESCTCLKGYSGQFCDQCSTGYYRPSGNPIETCLPCDCNNHTTLCDSATGICINCTGNTTGNYCQQCLTGFYDSDPSNNSMHCLQCQCPSAANSHSDTCTLMSNGTVSCDCDIGYIGMNCDQCDNGYYGDPINGECQLCNCNGNIDPTLDILGCNSTTGECLHCLNNTEGPACEICVEGYYGNASNQSCRECQCDLNTTISCDRFTGECICMSNNTVSDCSRCADDYYGDPTIDCYACPCNNHSLSCTLQNDVPICNCEKGYAGNNCQFCDNGYFGNATHGHCIDCKCNGNIDLSSGSSCDMVSGYCINCTNNTHGFDCSICNDGYYGNVTKGIPCRPCQCNPNGTAQIEMCERVTGICFCKQYVALPDCTQCITGYYGDPANNIECQQCQCPSVSNSHSSTCVLSNDSFVCNNCETGYTGERCEYCDNGYYGDAINSVCQPCDCNSNIDVSIGLVCNSSTGECLLCLNNTMGANCEQCLPGYYGDIANGIPCQKCSCHENGTEASVCNNITGDCHCLPNTNTSNCSQCQSGYWGLSQGIGCIPCNCCSNGSIIFSTCDKDTGRCDCLRGITDDKCCHGCSDGFYNFTETGCAPCNCSDQLSLSQSCNELGQCQCVSGAKGDKCDECSPGYIGPAPNCTKCHDCYFLWSGTLSEIAKNVTVLFDRINIALKYYDGYEVADVKENIKMIEKSLNMSKEVLLTISFDPNTISNITALIIQINQSYTKALADINILIKHINNVYTQLNVAKEFIDSINNGNYFINKGFSGINEIYANLTALNNTLKSLESSANNSYTNLISYHASIIAAWNIVNQLQFNYSSAEDDIFTAYNDSQAAAKLISMTDSFAANISLIVGTLNSVDNNIGTLENGTLATNKSVQSLNEDFVSLNNELTNLTSQLNTISSLAYSLNSSALFVNAEAQFNLMAVERLVAATNQALTDAQNLLYAIGMAQYKAVNASNTLSNSSSLAEDILAIPVPPIDSASNIAKGINDTIISESEIEQVIADANDSMSRAMEALSIAQNTSMKVQSLQELVNETVNNLTATQNALNTTKSSFSSSNKSLETVRKTLNEASSNINLLPNVSNNTLDIKQQELIDGDIKLNNLLSMSKNASDISNQIRSNVQKENDTLHSVISNVTNIVKQTEVKVNETNTRQQQIQQLDAKSTQLNETANEIAIQQLKNVLSDYQSKISEVKLVRQKIKDLEQELEDMTESFKEAAEKYKRCYKTP